MTIVTLRIVSVKGPDARHSFIIAMADDGERAMATTPKRIAKAII